MISGAQELEDANTVYMLLVVAIVVNIILSAMVLIMFSCILLTLVQKVTASYIF